ncbi:FAD-dependent monooxygenase [Agromyces sp. MMS24-JH15]|uniref:FAD-dependent monooxygenase n=1 Tax=Agromyces sp. MMS24-JH15 TaxID=3243765 RepID=UPI003749DBF6
MNQRILISGASVAGLTLAYWLARLGFAPTVVERAPDLRTGGNGVDIRGRSVAVVERMGLGAEIRAAAADVRGMRFVDADDRTIARLDTRDPDGVEILRGDLVRLLRDAIGSDVEFRFGDSIRALDQDDGGATVAFDHGGTDRFDLVIGADGIHSNVRRLAFGPVARFTVHRGHYFAFADADASLGEDRWMTIHNRPGRMAGIWRSGTHAQAKAYFLFRSPELAYDRRDARLPARFLTDAFADDTSWHVGDLLDTALADPGLMFDALSQVRMARWSTGRVALVGDAAWCASPASGAGAELALVGAYRLAIELAAAPGEHRLAFARAHDGHRGLVRARQRIGVNVRLMAPSTGLGRWIRNTVIRSPLVRAGGPSGRRTADDGTRLGGYEAALDQDS